MNLILLYLREKIIKVNNREMRVTNCKMQWMEMNVKAVDCNGNDDELMMMMMMIKAKWKKESKICIMVTVTDAAMSLYTVLVDLLRLYGNSFNFIYHIAPAISLITTSITIFSRYYYFVHDYYEVQYRLTAVLVVQWYIENAGNHLKLEQLVNCTRYRLVHRSAWQWVYQFSCFTILKSVRSVIIFVASG